MIIPRAFSGAPSDEESDDTTGSVSRGTAFIKPEERPSVGEPQRRVKKPKGRNTKRTPKSGGAG
ncbi:MAG: hypothetical protein QM706_17255 [Nitrospira sp.]